MSDVSGPRPMASAPRSLATTPLAHSLIYLRNKKLSGTLELRTSTDSAPSVFGGPAANRQARIDVWRGDVTFASTTPAVARFGAVAYELGFIDAATLDAVCMESHIEKAPEAELLMRRGAIGDLQRDQTTAEQIRRRVLHAFTFPPETYFGFVEGVAPPKPPKITVDLLSTIWRGILAFPPEHEIEIVLGRIGDAPLRLVSEAVLERADFDMRERAACEALIHRAMTVAELKALHPLPHDRTRLLAYYLVIAKCAEPHSLAHSGTMARTHQVDTDDDQQEDVYESGARRARSFELSCMKIRATTVSPTVATPSVVLVSPTDLGLEGIRRRVAALSNETSFAALGLPEGASLEAARAAYYRLARVWHPDRLPPHLQAVHDEVTQIFLHMTAAYRSLGSLDVAGT
jgi:hypothetical protein